MLDSNSDIFKEIRPYHDDEVNGAIKNLINDQEFLDLIMHAKFSIHNKKLIKIITPLLKFFLKVKFRNIKTVKQVQDQIANYMHKLIPNTIEKLNYEGLEKLEKNKPYLFISNHRNIAMDSALINWCLHMEGFPTVRIAMGDNLLKKDCSTILMKLNKTFIVDRSSTGRELLKSLKNLSKYIRLSLKEGNSIWIAQKSGRAKDGNDQTDPAMIKMLSLDFKKDKLSFSDIVNQMNIVPVSISYENDPCDIMMANEIHKLNINGSYEKTEFEDIDTIIKGILGKKGKVNVSFGSPLKGEFTTPEEVSAAIDAVIHKSYYLFPYNLIAAEQTKDEDDILELKEKWNQKLESLSPEIRLIVKNMYAKPVHNKKIL
ncbi:acyltransferase [Paraphotobacterium marinum]|uniref:Acyltransferase n=1 Tax=Paraphotobacterium marinum TaxID=1755811 RepID=A0A220VH86_9GAMM|nr:1-acyl-sn-glycerol-3-phosphate acyltransferase [Paraphotobacterium marinum]ASK79542.1 acyltransferase [Paraphotobacterium marinum]